MNNHPDTLRVALIMAGGAGERFWPLSRKNRPKQLLPLTRPDKSMLSESIERAAAIVGLEQVFIITGRHLKSQIMTAEPAFPANNIFAEPNKRNTAGALAYASAKLMARNPEHTPDSIALAVITADHRIGDEELFERTIRTALEAAVQKNALVTCGIVPTRPETGFGYIETDGEALSLDAEKGAPPVYKACSFHEKPDLERAKAFQTSGRHYWNSGMFFWKLSVFESELQKAHPSLSMSLDAMTLLLKNNDEDACERIFNLLENISIDYALMEKSRNVLMVRGDFPWSDVGAWNAVSAPESRDAHGNYATGDPVLVDCTNCIVYNGTGGDKMAVGVVGMSDTIVVTTEDGVLVLPADRAQDVRAVVEALKRRNARQL